jgi:hypothetical protein
VVIGHILHFLVCCSKKNLAALLTGVFQSNKFTKLKSWSGSFSKKLLFKIRIGPAFLGFSVVERAKQGSML